jgi:hypothetical protein
VTHRQRSGAPPPDVGPAPERSSRHHAAGQPHGNAPDPVREVIAVAFVSPPIGRRTLPLLVVVDCPTCHHVHTHRSTGPHGGRRVGSCGTAYVVRVAGDKRARWSA